MIICVLKQFIAFDSGYGVYTMCKEPKGVFLFVQSAIFYVLCVFVFIFGE